MKYFGGVLVVLYAVMALWGWEPFSSAQRGKVTRGTTGSTSRYRSGSFMGGK